MSDFWLLEPMVKELLLPHCCMQLTLKLMSVPTNLETIPECPSPNYIMSAFRKCEAPFMRTLTHPCRVRSPFTATCPWYSPVCNIKIPSHPWNKTSATHQHFPGTDTPSLSCHQQLTSPCSHSLRVCYFYKLFHHSLTETYGFGLNLASAPCTSWISASQRLSGS